MINSISDFINASKTFSIPLGKIKEKEKGRKEFIAKFPISKIQSLSIEEYCIGTSENSFCYWLEFKDILFGIGGGNASKFGIYKSKDGNYYEKAGPEKLILQGFELEEKFSRIKESFLQGLQYVEQNKISEIEKIQTSVWNMVLLKIFTIYYPDRFLTIGDPLVIAECAKSIGITGVEFKNENSILLNYLCREKLNETKEFSDWEYEKIGTFVWETFRKTAKRDYYIVGSKYGVNADIDKFPEMLDRSVIATGFASEIDLTEIYNEKHSTIKDFLSKHNEENNSINALKHFLSIRPGDLIAIKSDGSPKGNEGYLSIVGIAEVVEVNGKVYEYDQNGLGHIIHVKYLEAPIFKELSLGGYGRTVHKLSNDEHIKLIFKVDNNMSYYPEIEKFLEQAKSSVLGTSDYLNNFQGLSVKVSFGKGNQARVPWIAFLNVIDSVQEGIYPVYLYYKEKDLLILAYGVSETKKPSRTWNLIAEITITEYFSKNNLGTPERYGSSYVFRTYDTKKPLNEKEVDGDLIQLISIYKSTHTKSPQPSRKFQAKEFEEILSIAGLFFSSKTITRFISALITKPFVILSGLSGSGKTKLAQAFAQWICQDYSQYCIVPVGADWTNREPLLGYPNALKPDEYIKPDNGALDVIIEANKHPEHPYFLILDEMNLSHVERYFADFLSVMESKGEISLFAEGKVNNGVPAKLALPSNLFIIGTVNIDETTYMFSPKVLDRANAIEFRVTKNEIENFFASQQEVDMNKLKTQGASMAQSFLKMAEEREFAEEDLTDTHKTLVNFFKQLKKTGAEFGYRSATEIIRLINQLAIIDAGLGENEKLDIAIMQKLLPKLHGSRRKLCPVLIILGSFCVDNAKLENIEKEVFAKEDFDFESDGVIYPISLEKITRMYRGAIENGFASYAEA